MTVVVRTHAMEVAELPRDRAAIQRVLRRHGMKGYRVESVEDPVSTERGAECRAYCLTRPRLSADNEMRRAAVTVVFSVGADDELTVTAQDGWVPRPARWPDRRHRIELSGPVPS